MTVRNSTSAKDFLQFKKEIRHGKFVLTEFCSGD